MATPNNVPVNVGRTSTQTAVATAIVQALVAFNVVDLTPEQYGILVVLLTIIVAGVQNIVENKAGWGFLKGVFYRDEE